MIVYLKKPPADPRQTYRHWRINNFFNRLKSLLPTVMLVVGASLIISVGYPILSYELTVGIKSRRQSILAPVPQEVLAQGNYEKVSTWFNFTRPQAFLSPSNITHYSLSIPKLRIKEALITIGGDNLGASLIQYGGTANPGEAGNTVIFGHSILPQFYNPSSYRSIFSLLPTLKTGDEIFINFDGITYKYVVYDYVEVSPSDVDILEQSYNRKELTLVTCVPPGTYTRRGLVKAKLVEI